MPKMLYFLANLLAAFVLVLLFLDPTRPLAPVFVLLGLAFVCAIAATLIARR
jgi:hypothetical protein